MFVQRCWERLVFLICHGRSKHFALCLGEPRIFANQQALMWMAMSGIDKGLMQCRVQSCGGVFSEQLPPPHKILTSDQGRGCQFELQQLICC